MASSSTRVLYPVPRNLPSELHLPGDLDLYEPARLVFRRVMALVQRPAYHDLKSKELRLFLRDQRKYMVCSPSLSFLFILR